MKKLPEKNCKLLRASNVMTFQISNPSKLTAKLILNKSIIEYNLKLGNGGCQTESRAPPRRPRPRRASQRTRRG